MSSNNESNPRIDLPTPTHKPGQHSVDHTSKSSMRRKEIIADPTLNVSYLSIVNTVSLLYKF